MGDPVGWKVGTMLLSLGWKRGQEKLNSMQGLRLQARHKRIEDRQGAWWQLQIWTGERGVFLCRRWKIEAQKRVGRRRLKPWWQGLERRAKLTAEGAEQKRREQEAVAQQRVRAQRLMGALLWETLVASWLVGWPGLWVAMVGTLSYLGGGLFLVLEGAGKRQDSTEDHQGAEKGQGRPNQQQIRGGGPGEEQEGKLSGQEIGDILAARLHPARQIQTPGIIAKDGITQWLIDRMERKLPGFLVIMNTGLASRPRVGGHWVLGEVREQAQEIRIWDPLEQVAEGTEELAQELRVGQIQGVNQGNGHTGRRWVDMWVSCSSMDHRVH